MNRGGLINTVHLVKALKSGKIGGVGLDVYENEQDLFFEDHSDKVSTDDLYARLSTFRNVLLTGHQAFLTEEALNRIAEVTFNNVSSYVMGMHVEGVEGNKL
jgi:D-lactate dehydrogenase